MELTASMVKCFKQCPRRYELEYVHCLKPKKTAEYLTLGTNYHALVEKILKEEHEPDWSGVAGAMANAFHKYVPWREWDLAGVEQEFRTDIYPDLWLCGKVDAILTNGTIVEHKTFGGGDWDKYVHHLAWDDQVSLYLLAHPQASKVIYTVCKKPTIRQKNGETQEQYEERCWHWYDPEEGGADKMRVFEVTRARGELKDTEWMLRDICDLIAEGRFYRNPQACALVPCPYESICLSYRGEIVPVAFEKKERTNEELCKF